MNILDETSQVIAYSRRLEQQRQELASASAELRTANERLRQIDQVKDDFLATITHELRTPLTSIRAFSEILYDHPEIAPERRERILSTMMRETDRLTRIINQVLDLEKIESGTAAFQLTELNMRDLIAASIDATSQLFVERNVRVEVHLPDEVPPLLADQDRVVQVMLNLLGNAAKFCDQQRGWVGVLLEVEPDALRVDVSDNGRGISDQDQQLIFEKFRQAHGQRADTSQGAGLGLTICREIITRHGGALWVLSEPGAGATFSFRLPLVG